MQLAEDGTAEGTPVLVSMTASATLTRTQSMSPFISPSGSLQVPYNSTPSGVLQVPYSTTRTDTVSSFCQISPTVSPSASPSSMPPPLTVTRPDTVSSFCRVSPSVSPEVSPVPPKSMAGLELGLDLGGKTGKVLGVPLEAELGRRAPLSDSNCPEAKKGNVGEGFAEDAENQVKSLVGAGGGLTLFFTP